MGQETANLTTMKVVDTLMKALGSELHEEGLGLGPGEPRPRVIPRAASTALMRDYERQQAVRKATVWERLCEAEARARIVLSKAAALQEISGRHREAKDTIGQIQYQVRMIHRHCWNKTAPLEASGIEVGPLLGRLERIEEIATELVVERFEAWAEELVSVRRKRETASSARSPIKRNHERQS